MITARDARGTCSPGRWLDAVSLPSAASEAVSGLDRLLLRGVDGCLAAVVCFVPFVMGGRQALGHFVLAMLSCAAAAAWCTRQMLRREAWIRTGAEWLCLAAVAVVGLQLLPVPGLANVVSPAVAGVLPLWSNEADPASLGTWQQLTLNPYETRVSLALLASYVLLFLTASQRIRDRADVERIVAWLGAAAVVMAVFGVVQYLTSNGRFFWFYQHPYTDTLHRVKGAFTNKNHFAHFLALGVGPLMWALLGPARWRGEPAFQTVGGRSARDTLPALALVGLAAVAFAGMLSLSRGGVVALAAASAVCGVMLFRAGLLGRKAILGCAGLVLLTAGFLAVYGQQAVAHRLDDFFAADIEQLDQASGRRTIWKAVAAGIGHFALFGSGAGTHRDVYPIYLSGPVPVEFTHAENGYLQVALETGIVGLGLMLAAAVLCVHWCLAAFRTTRAPAPRALAACLMGGFAASLIHSLVDFVWYVPGIMAVMALLAACACRNAQLAAAAVESAASPQTAEAEERAAWARAFAGPRWGVAAAGSVLLGGWMALLLLPRIPAEAAWHEYLNLVIARHGEPTEESGRATDPTAMIRALQQTLAADPHHARAHLRLARLALLQFNRLQASAENAMSVEQIRDAAQASQFASREDLQAWLERAVGRNSKFLTLALAHAQRGLRESPLEGDGYVYLAKLAFLDLLPPEANDRYLAQAVRVRPFEGRIRMAAGKEALLKMDLDGALTHLRTLFQFGGADREKVVDLLIGARIGPQFFLERFDLDRESLELLVGKYRSQQADARVMEPLLSRYAAVTVETAERLQGPEAAAAWLDAHKLYVGLGDARKASAAVDRAYEADSNSINVRLALGVWLYRQGDLPRAAVHLQWCAERRPNNASLQKLARAAAAGLRLAQPDESEIRRE